MKFVDALVATSTLCVFKCWPDESSTVTNPSKPGRCEKEGSREAERLWNAGQEKDEKKSTKRSPAGLDEKESRQKTRQNTRMAKKNAKKKQNENEKMKMMKVMMMKAMTHAHPIFMLSVHVVTVGEMNSLNDVINDANAPCDG